MARYVWKYGNYKKTMKLGTLEYNYTINETDYSETVSGVTYICKKLALGNHVETSWPEPTWTAGENISDGEAWTSGSAGLTIYATLNNGDYRCGYGKPSIDGERFTSNYWASVKSYDMGVYAFKGDYIIDASNRISGVFIVYAKLGGEDLAFSDALFLSDNFFETAEKQNPYDSDMDETKAGDISGDGGYPNGFPVGNPAATSENKGAVFPFGSGVHVYVITPAQLNEFSRYMWGSAAGVFDEGGLWGKFQNYKFNPIAGILSCHSLPLVLMPTGSGSASISIAGTTLATATGAPCGTQFTTWVSNSIGIPEPWGTFVDYAYATISVYLPFCGVVPVDVSAVVGGSIYVRYYCDVINGNVSAWIVGTDRNGVQQLLKTATGNAAYHIPITGNDNGQGEIIGSIKQAVSSGLSGNVVGLINAGVNIISGAEQHHTESVGSMNGNAGYCASTEVFLICNWSYPIYTGNYDYIRGRPSEVSGTVGSFSGYNTFEVHADSISGATDEEKREIETLLNSGVYV